MIEFVVSLKDLVTESAKKMGESVTDLAGHMTKVVEPAEVMKGALEGVKEGFSEFANSIKSGDVEGAITGITQALAGVAQILDLVVPGLGQAASAIISALGGIAGATVGLIQEGAKLALEQNALQASLIATYSAMGGSAEAGNELYEMTEKLAGQMPGLEKLIQSSTKTYAAMGLSVEDVEGKVRATASAFALNGEKGASAFEKITKKVDAFAKTGQKITLPVKGLGSLVDMGLNVDDVAKKMGISTAALGAQLKKGGANAAEFGKALQSALSEKGAGPLEKMGLEIGSQIDGLKKSFMDLFKGVDVEPFLKALKDLFSIFQEGKPAANTLHAGIVGGLNAVFAAATKVIPVVKHLFLQMIILGLKAYIFLFPIVKTIKQLWQQFHGTEILVMALKGLAIILGVVAAAVLLMVSPFIIAAAATMAFITNVSLIVGAVGGMIIDTIDALSGWVSGAVTMAGDFVQGLIDGITSGAGRVADAAKDLAKGAMTGVKSFLGISSPSKVMMQLGGHTAGGFAEGMNAGSDAVSSAASGMGGAAAGGAPSAKDFAGAGDSSGKSDSGGGSGKTVTIDVGGININGAGKSAEAITEEMISLIFERVAMQQGVA